MSIVFFGFVKFVKFVKFVVNEVVKLDVHSGGPNAEGSEEDEPVG